MICAAQEQAFEGQSFMQRNIYILASLLILLSFSYIVFDNKEAGVFISKLDNITRIKVISVKEENLFEIDEEKKISYFLSTFKPSQNNPSKKAENFEINGYILFMEDSITKFKIAIDYNYGYSCKIKNTDYLEQFTYATHRYLLDIKE